MKSVIGFTYGIFFIALTLTISCKKEMPCEGCATKNNKSPIAVAGPDQVITLPTDSVLLDGSSSSDQDGMISSYLWTKISGPASFNIIKQSDSVTKVRALVAGTYLFELKVIDNGGLSAKDTVQVAVNTTPPPTACDPLNRPIITAQLIPFGTLSEAKVNVTVGAAGNKIVYAGGRNWANDESSASVDIYDIATNTWSVAQLSAPREGMAVATCGTKIFFGGGWYTNSWTGYHSNKVDIYDASTNAWSVASLSVSRSDLAAASVGNKVFFAGGYDNVCICPLNTIDIYDLTTNTWTTATLSEARSSLSVTTIGSKVYFAGGRMGYYLSSGRIDIYDNNNSTWTTSTLSEPKGAMASIAVGSKIYWAGGRLSSNDPNENGINTVEIRDVIAQTTSLSCLWRPNNWNYIQHEAVEKNNQLIFFVGWVGCGDAQSKFDIYDMANNSWSVGVLNQGICGAALISVNNTIYVAGGLVNGFATNQVRKLEF